MIWRLALVAVVAIVGYVFVSEATGELGVRDKLETESTEDLTRILSRLETQRADLEAQRERLRSEVDELDGSARDAAVAQEGALREIETLRMLSGELGAHGPGVTVTIAGAEPVGFERLLDLVQEARDAGAEAIALNDVRVVASTWFGQSGGQPTLDGEPVEVPIMLVAIGDPQTLAGGLGIPGGALERIQADGYSATIAEHADVEVPQAVDR
ncbi:MAG: DUF881 domain-containing protein [Actinobacteria bacterium]|nr:DUF881 domain-containing protein [Actinomycetota bacterium]MCB9388609.1 DUF881 domain-containing protein [Acidimicrobiia bacterium]